jgi:nitrate reductase NapE component
MKPSSFVLGFLPWIAFTIVANRLAANAVAWSALIAVAMTVVALSLARRRGAPVTLNAVSLVLFALIAVTGFVGGRGVDVWLYTWGRPLVGVVLGLYVLATASVRPFTEEYARQSTPREHWGSPTFRSINRVISAAWGVGLVAIGVCGVLVAVLDQQATTSSSDHLVELLLNWVVPIAVVWGLFEFTTGYPDRVTGRLQRSSSGAEGSGGHA